MTSKTRIVYRELDVISIPEDIPELGIKTGHLGTIDYVYSVRGEPGRGLYVEVSRNDGSTVGFVQLEADEEGAWHVMAYSVFG